MVTLAWPPSVNNYYTIARGRKILSKNGRLYKQQAVMDMLVQKVEKRKSDSYTVYIRAYPPDKRKRDLDNAFKAILDSLVEYGAIQDDSLIDDLRIQRFNVVKYGRIDVLISGHST